MKSFVASCGRAPENSENQGLVVGAPENSENQGLVVGAPVLVCLTRNCKTEAKISIRGGGYTSDPEFQKTRFWNFFWRLGRLFSRRTPPYKKGRRLEQ